MPDDFDIDDKFFNEPLLTTPVTPANFKKMPWRDLNTPSAYIFVGNKRSGKDVAMDNELLINQNAGFTTLSIFDGGGHEKLYCAITKNCKGKWELVNKVLKVFEKKVKEYLNINEILDESKLENDLLERVLGLMASENLVEIKDKSVRIVDKGYDELEGKLLHCKCNKGHYVTVIKPPYVKYSKEELDRFNGYYFKNFQEYVQAFTKGFVNEFLDVETDYTKIKKPKSMTSRIKPKLIIVEAPVPRSTAKNIQDFIKIFTEELIDSRKNRRILVGLNPAFYPPGHQGKDDKYHTFAVIMDNLKSIADKHFIPLSLNKPRNQYTTEEKAFHKIALFVGEVRKPVPSAGMSPDTESKISKRSFFAFMPESRHAKVFPRINAQSIADVLKGVNKQNDIIIVKRSSEGNLGEELGWLAKEMHRDIVKRLVRWRVWDIIDGKVIEKPISSMNKKRLIDRAGLCEIGELPDNRAIVVNGNKEWRMTKYDSPSFHHKSDRDEFSNDTGIHFKFDPKVTLRMADESNKKPEETGNSIKELRELIYMDYDEEYKKGGLTANEIHKILLKKYTNDQEKKSIIEKIKPNSLSKNYRRWKNSSKKVL